MANKNLTPEQAKRQKENLKKFHANPNKPTSAGTIRTPRMMDDVRRKFTELNQPSLDIISKGVRGQLIPEMTVWKGTPEQKDEILRSDPSASFEMQVLDNGKEVEMLVEYVPVSQKRIELAKWITTQEIALKKFLDESKLRKIEIAMKNKKAQSEGAIPKEDPVEKAKSFGGPKLVTEFNPDDVESEDTDYDE